MTPEQFLAASISEVGACYRSGSLSPVDVTQAALGRIQQHNDSLNAFITVTADLALEQARQATRELQAGQDRGPLHGIPVALKDLVDVQGVRTTCGARMLADQVATEDALVTCRLRDAGAVLVGKTNLLEFAYGVVHPDYGQTNNPWDAGRTAGGSSGGSAAAVASGMCYAALGTDTGGSIRIPAAYCGVSGLKPTYGRVPLDGIFPLSWSLDHAGPIARSCQDARLMLRAMLGEALEAIPPVLKGKRFGLLQAHFSGLDMTPGVGQVMTEVCQALVGAGATLHDVQVPDLPLAEEALMQVLLPEASVIHDHWLQTRAADYAPNTRLQLELGYAVSAVGYLQAQQFRRRLVKGFLEAMRDVDAILTPTVAWTAPVEDPVIAGQEGATEGRRTAPANLTGFPALSVNAGWYAGLPVGVQITTRPGEDALALALGEGIERLMDSTIRTLLPEQ